MPTQTASTSPAVDPYALAEGETAQQRADRITASYVPANDDERAALLDPRYAAYRHKLRLAGYFALDRAGVPAV